MTNMCTAREVLAAIRGRMQRVIAIGAHLLQRMSSTIAGSILGIVGWCVVSVGLPMQSLAQSADQCAGAGGNAVCIGPETGPYLYKALNPNVGVGQGPTQDAAVTAFNQVLSNAINHCGYTVTNHLSPWPQPSVGTGNASGGTQGSTFWDIFWQLSTDYQEDIQYLQYDGTSGNSCQTPFSIQVNLNRSRLDHCPGAGSGSPYVVYQANNVTTPTIAYCWRAPSDLDLPKTFGGNCPTNRASGSAASCSATDTSSKMISNPVHPITGNKFQPESDYVGAGPMPLAFVRYYNSQLTTAGIPFSSALGPSWRSSYDRQIVFANSAAYATAYVYRQDGRTLHFVLTGGQFVPDADIADRLVELVDGSGHLTGWKYTIAANDEVETYNASGQLILLTSRSGFTQTLAYDSSNRLSTVTDTFGRTLTLAYDASSRLSTLRDPAGGIYTYAYNNVNNVTSVTYPDTKVRTEVYDELANTSNTDQPYVLTGIVDESNGRFATYQYDSSGRVSSSAHAGGADQYAFSYNQVTNKNIVTDPLGTVRTLSYAVLQGVAKNSAVSQPCLSSCGGAASATTYDANGNIASLTDFNGNVTTYSYDLTRNLELSRTEAYNSPHARTVTTQWNATYRLPSLITEADRSSQYGYDPSGNLVTKTLKDLAAGTTRVWTYTYDTYGRMLTADGPRTDVIDKTTYTYYTCTAGYQCGQLHTVVDANSRVTTYNTYNAHGQPLTITDPNGVVTTLMYDFRMRLTSRQVGTETTSFSYWPTGLLKQVTLPDSSYIVYTYDGAHRLTQINDQLGNKIVYTLDNMGNRTAENSYDPSSVLHRTHSRVYNTLNELYQDVNSAGTAAVTATFGYDHNGNQTSIAAPLARNTANAYDELNRLAQITDPASGITKFAYDAEDNLSSVIDPRTLTTSYTYTGFGDLKTQTSPDTGTTTNTYDSGGNLATSTDARGAVSTYNYDVLNRVTSVAYKIGTTTDQTIAFTYDSGTNGIGRLTGASDANHSMSWTYDALGRVTGKGQVVGSVTRSVGYGYTNGDLTSLVTPSGQTVVYGYNSNHQIASITINGTTLLNGVTYEPFGGVNKWTWGNATVTTRTYDTDQKITQISSQGIRTNGYDNAFRITKITNTTTGASTYTYGYDLLDRVTSGVGGVNQTFTYDGNGNRLTVGGSGSSTYSVSPTSNRVTGISGTQSKSYTYDAAGNPLTYSPVSLTYNDRGRLQTVQTTSNMETIVYNALGQMVKVSGGSPGTVLYAYDEAGHLIGEYSSTGALIEETVWLGDTPVATLRPHAGGGIDTYYVHTDHLNTPHLVTRPSDNLQIWRWFPPTFGDSLPNTNPGGAGIFTYNLRFPGQIYDSQAGLHQNYFRDFDPAVGRYTESDRIGLRGGLHSTYLYAHGDPISNSDASGLAPPGRTGTPTIPTLIPPNIAIPGTAESTAWAQQAAQQIDDALSGIGQAIYDACLNDKKEHCDELLRIDTDTCNAITRRRGARAGESCHASATERYAACLRGRPLPPLNTWNN